MVTDAIYEIEDNIDKLIKISNICDKLHVSEFHFNRLFTVITGITPKQYIIRRKLTLAAQELISTDSSIMHIAMKWGFNYSEDFSRSFKKHFNISPIEFRNNAEYINNNFGLEPIRSISEREFINKNGRIELKATYKHMEQIALAGLSTIVANANGDHYQALDQMGKKFLAETADNNFLQQEVFYSLVKCSDNEKGLFDVYLGKAILNSNNIVYETRIIPRGWYVCFNYDGEIQQIYDDFEQDLYKWVIQSNIELIDIGINMISRYCISDTGANVEEIWVPIKQPKQQLN